MNEILVFFEIKINELNKANPENWSTNHDVDALITVEVLLVTPEHADGERLQIANIQFNNLDIIGNYTYTVIPNVQHAS